MQHCNIDCNYLHICLWPISHLPGFYFTIRGRGEVLLNYYSHKQTQSKLCLLCVSFISTSHISLHPFGYKREQP